MCMRTCVHLCVCVNKMKHLIRCVESVCFKEDYDRVSSKFMYVCEVK